MPFTVSGVTINGFVQAAQVDGGDQGLCFFGSIVNTGSNGLSIRLTTTDYYGNTDVFTPATIAAGGSARFDSISFSFGANTKPPFRNIKLEVAAAVNNNQTTYTFIVTQF
jgi:hypothetical protein